MGKIAFLFPGQGSQSVGMGKSIANANSQAQAIFEKADQRLNERLSTLIFEGPESDLTLTVNAQPALVTTSIAIYEVFKEMGIKADYTAGHSLGEYSALVAAGVISFEDAVYAVRMRGIHMTDCVQAGEGAMAAVLGLNRDVLKEITDDVSASGHIVELANLNCPGQIVISGTKEGLERATKMAKEQGARRVIPLAVSGPFHSSLMKPAAEKLASVLDELQFNDANTPVVANVSAKPETAAVKMKENLLMQVYSPVQWEDTIQFLLNDGVDTFIEIGPGNVLSGLVKKVNRKVTTYSINDLTSLHAVVESLKGAN